MSTTETPLPNYRIYDRTGGGVRQDIYIAYTTHIGFAEYDGNQFLYDGNFEATKTGTKAEVVAFLESLLSLVNPQEESLRWQGGNGWWLMGDEARVAIKAEMLNLDDVALEKAIEAGRDWIEDGDWSGTNDKTDDCSYAKGEVVELPCCVREIVRWPKDPLPGQYEDEDGDIFDTDGALLCYASERGQINDHETDHGQSWDCTGTYTER